MYLDRICLAQIVTSDSFQQSIALKGWQIDWVKGAFFWAYALAQVPAGWLSDRFSKQRVIVWMQFTQVAVTLVDRLGPGTGCSFGNAGILASMAAVPVGLPGFERQLPHMLLDPDSPLVLRWRALPQAIRRRST